MEYFDALKARRSVYALNKELPVSQDAVVSAIEQAVVLSPSAFNVQSARAVVLLGEQHAKLWDIVTAALKAHVPADAFASTQQKMDMFAAAAGSVLFFDDTAAVEDLKKQFPSYADAFDGYAAQASGMAQVNVWQALAELGVGANLQHYNPLIDAEVKRTWDIPESWKLVSQMNFGGIAAAPEAQDRKPASERVRVVR